jgi:Ca2+-binding RTX toxin-like protein
MPTPNLPAPFKVTQGNDIILNSTLSNISIDAGGGDDYFKISGGILNVTLRGGLGVDTFDLDGQSLTVGGGQGNDIIKGTVTSSTLKGDGGNDVMTLTATGSSLFGDDGDDVLTLTSLGKNSLSGGSGVDTIFHTRLNDTSPADTISGGAGNDVMTSSGNGSLIKGDDGHDTLTIIGNRNKIDAGAGNDVIKITGDDNSITLGAGFDNVFFTQSNSAVITDFNHYGDKISFSSNIFSSTTDVLNHFHAASGGQNAYIDMGGGHHLEFTMPHQFNLWASDIQII